MSRVRFPLPRLDSLDSVIKMLKEWREKLNRMAALVPSTSSSEAEFRVNSIIVADGSSGNIKDSKCYVTPGGRMGIYALPGTGIDLHIQEDSACDVVFETSSGDEVELSLKNTMGEWQFTTQTDGDLVVTDEASGGNACFGIKKGAPGGSVLINTQGDLEVAGHVEIQTAGANSHEVELENDTDEFAIRADGAELKFRDKNLEVELAAIDKSGNFTLSGTVDGRDLATDGTKLDGIEASADVTDATNVRAAGAVMEAGGDLTNNAIPVADSSGDLEDGSLTDDGATVNVNALLRLQREALVISSGAVTATKSYLRVESESGSSDDLDSVSGLASIGQICVITARGGHTITVKDGVGNIACGSDATLVGSNRDTWMGIWDGANLIEISRSSN